MPNITSIIKCFGAGETYNSIATLRMNLYLDYKILVYLIFAEYVEIKPLLCEVV